MLLSTDFNSLLSMKRLQCLVHNETFQLPITDEEFLSGKMHEEVEKIQAHTEENNDCKIKEVKK